MWDEIIKSMENWWNHGDFIHFRKNQKTIENAWFRNIFLEYLVNQIYTILPNFRKAIISIVARNYCALRLNQKIGGRFHHSLKGGFHWPNHLPTFNFHWNWTFDFLIFSLYISFGSLDWLLLWHDNYCIIRKTASSRNWHLDTFTLLVSSTKWIKQTLMIQFKGI